MASNASDLSQANFGHRPQKYGRGHYNFFTLVFLILDYDSKQSGNLHLNQATRLSVNGRTNSDPGQTQTPRYSGQLSLELTSGWKQPESVNNSPNIRNGKHQLTPFKRCGLQNSCDDIAVLLYFSLTSIFALEVTYESL